MYADPALDTKPALLDAARRRVLLRGGGRSCARRCSAVDGGTSTQVVNVRNDGTLPFLPDDAVIEVPGAVDRAGGATRCRSRRSTPLYAGLIAHVTAYEQLALDAALHGGRDRVFDALLAHPLVGQVDLADGLDRPAARPQPRATCRGP